MNAEGSSQQFPFTVPTRVVFFASSRCDRRRLIKKAVCCNIIPFSKKRIHEFHHDIFTELKVSTDIIKMLPEVWPHAQKNGQSASTSIQNLILNLEMDDVADSHPTINVHYLTCSAKIQHGRTTGRCPLLASAYFVQEGFSFC